MRVALFCLTLVTAFASLSAGVGLLGTLPDEPPASGGSPVHARRDAAKILVADDAIRGHLSLAEAASLFRAMHAVPPVPVYPGDVTDEWYCRRVILQVQVRAEHAASAGADAAPLEAGVARMEAELKAMADAGPVRLPDPETLTPVAELLERGEAFLEALHAGRDTAGLVP